jgi:hypothetical protein
LWVAPGLPLVNTGIGVLFVYNLFFSGQIEIAIRLADSSSVCDFTNHGYFI